MHFGVLKDDESESEAKTDSGHRVCLLLVGCPHLAWVEHAQCPLLAHRVSVCALAHTHTKARTHAYTHTTQQQQQQQKRQPILEHMDMTTVIHKRQLLRNNCHSQEKVIVQKR